MLAPVSFQEGASVAPMPTESQVQFLALLVVFLLPRFGHLKGFFKKENDTFLLLTRCLRVSDWRGLTCKRESL